MGVAHTVGLSVIPWFEPSNKCQLTLKTTKPGTIRSMQNTIRWFSDQFQPTQILNPWSNQTDANLEDSELDF